MKNLQWRSMDMIIRPSRCTERSNVQVIIRFHEFERPVNFKFSRLLWKLFSVESGLVLAVVRRSRPKQEDRNLNWPEFRFWIKRMLLLLFLIQLWLVEASHNEENRPVLQELFVPKKLVENQNLKLNCDLMQGAKPIRFSWFFNDEPINESERLQIETRIDASSLVIKRLSVDNIGKYRCLAANDQGSDQQTVVVHVNSKRISCISILNYLSPKGN